MTIIIACRLKLQSSYFCSLITMYSAPPTSNSLMVDFITCTSHPLHIPPHVYPIHCASSLVHTPSVAHPAPCSFRPLHISSSSQPILCPPHPWTSRRQIPLSVHPVRTCRPLHIPTTAHLVLSTSQLRHISSLHIPSPGTSRLLHIPSPAHPVVCSSCPLHMPSPHIPSPCTSPPLHIPSPAYHRPCTSPPLHIPSPAHPMPARLVACIYSHMHFPILHIIPSNKHPTPWICRNL